MDCLTSFFKQHSMIDKFNQLWAIMPPYPGFACMNKPNSQMMKLNGRDMGALGRIIVSPFVATLLNPLVSQTIPFTDHLLCFKTIVYFHFTAHYRYHTEATIEYMEKYLEELHSGTNAFSQFLVSDSSKKVSEAMKTQLTLDQQEERESNPAWNDISASAKCHCIDRDRMQMESEITQDLVDKSDFKVMKMHLLNHLSDHVGQLGSLLNASSELPDWEMKHLEQAYCQSNRHETTILILGTNNLHQLFQYRELNAYMAKQRRDIEKPLTEEPI